MNLTNRKNLPDIIMRAVANDPYDSGDSDYTASGLIRPAWQSALQDTYKDEIEEDAADRLWALYGSAVHYIMERATGPDDIVEKRFFADVDGHKVSAQIDHFNNGIISDWKLTAAYKITKVITEGDSEEWEQQLNIQAYCMGENGYDIDQLFIGAMCRDWSAFDAKTKPNYPDQIEFIEIPLWSKLDQLMFIRKRIKEMKDPAPCTQKERWQPDPDFALTKKGGTRPAKVEPTYRRAFEYAESKGWVQLFNEPVGGTSVALADEYEILTREGPNRRCEGYCNVNKFCPFYQEKYMKAEDLPFKTA